MFTPFMNIFFVIFLTFIPMNYSINYLTNNQKYLIKTILKHPQSTPYMIDKVQQILYYHYQYKAMEMAFDFKKKYSIKTKHIQFLELKIYASKGLLMAIKNYNPDYPFINHMRLYVNGQLHQGMSDLHPLTILPKTMRLSKKWKAENKKTYNALINTKFVGNDEYLYDKNMVRYKVNNYKEYEFFIKVWNIINNLDIEYQRIMRYKYNFLLEKLRPNSEVAQLMCCSDECVRKKLLYVKNTIREKLSINNILIRT
jgi:hypothetical protein